MLNLPNAYIIGVQKAGTTTLFDWIGQHPNVYVNPASKDYPFFCSDEAFLKGVESFSKYFSSVNNEKIILGASANDLYIPQAAFRIHKVIPSAKIIVILRDPVFRAFSAYRYAVERSIEKRTFQQAVEDEINGMIYADPFENRQKSYLLHGLYSEQLERIFTLFSKEQILILQFGDLISNPESTMRKVFNFLGIDEDFLPTFNKINETRGGNRFKLINKVLYNQKYLKKGLFKVIRGVIPPNIRYIIRQRLVEINRIKIDKIDLQDEIKECLTTYYQDDLKKVSKILNDIKQKEKIDS